MANKTKFQAMKGTRDLLPPETELWNRVEATARQVFGTFGFGEIRPPIFEPTELFAQAVGGETDIVSKEMYTFGDKPKDFAVVRDGHPEEFVASVRRAMEIEQIPHNDKLLGILEFHKENFQLRAESSLEQAWLKWVYIADNLILGESISLRPEATASVCRAYIEHNMQQL